LAGGCPQPVAASALFRMVSPGGPQERNCNLAPKLLLVRADNNEIDWSYKACKKKVRFYCAELILWTSRTGD
jgi:hypothetical protein